jgi:hypothetical protein
MSSDFKDEWVLHQNEIKKLASEFLQNSKWKEHFYILNDRKTECLFRMKNGFEPHFKNSRRDVRIDFIAWNLQRLEK